MRLASLADATINVFRGLFWLSSVLCLGDERWTPFSRVQYLQDERYRQKLSWCALDEGGWVGRWVGGWVGKCVGGWVCGRVG